MKEPRRKQLGLRGTGLQEKSVKPADEQGFLGGPERGMGSGRRKQHNQGQQA